MSARLLRRRAAALVLSGASLALAACGGGDDGQAGSGNKDSDHVWKDQTQAIGKARDVERQLRESRKQQ